MSDDTVLIPIPKDIVGYFEEQGQDGTASTKSLIAAALERFIDFETVREQFFSRTSEELAEKIEGTVQ
jgi:hypothetical protein